MRKTRLLNYKDAGHGLRTKVGFLFLLAQNVNLCGQVWEMRRIFPKL